MHKYLYQDLYNLEDKHFWHLGKRELADKIIKKYLSVKKPQILDIGCGTGKNLDMLNKIGYSYGIDASPEAIKFCKLRKLNNVSLGKAENTGFNNNSFDLVTMFDVLEHTSESKTLAEASRIIKSPGYLLITVPAYKWLWSKWDEVLKHKKRYTKNEIKEILDRYGFKTIKTSYFFSYLLIPVIITRFIKQLMRKEDYGSDFSINNPIINFIAKLANLIEQFIISRSSLPFGTSVMVLAKKE